MRRVVPWIVGVLLLTAVLVIGLTQAREQPAAEPRAAEPFDLDEARRALVGAPAPLAALHAQSARLLRGGPPAFRRRLAQLEGHPVVINKWASWCGPCKAEFPAFQQLASERGTEIAFLGLNAGDSSEPARDFLAAYPVPFPSYVDPDEKIARGLGVPANYPITVFVDAAGKTAFIHQGAYATKAQLEADVDRYLSA